MSFLDSLSGGPDKSTRASKAKEAKVCTYHLTLADFWNQ
tara:strand:- start:148 stop:264 length:117 start_codon:yes stop_codon:yes gene_type:complete